MNVLMVANFCRDFSETDNGRFFYIAKMLSKYHKVELLTSSFEHDKKEQRSKNYNNLPFKLTLIKEPGYPTNICLQRFVSHYIFGKNVEGYVKKLNYKPDAIYCAMPSLTCAYRLIKYAKKNRIKTLVDIQDLWPEAFAMVFNIPVISDLIFLPMKKIADYSYSYADTIVAVSKTYARRALLCRRKINNKLIVVYLGTERKTFDKYRDVAFDRCKTQNGFITIGYVGTLGKSYDITNTIEAIRKLPNKYKVKLLVMGDGPLEDTFKEQAQKAEIEYEFTGRLDYSEMVERLSKCDIAINPIKKGSAGSIINKVGDYAMAGLPVINTQESKEYRQLLSKYDAGINCTCEDVIDIMNAIMKLIDNPDMRINMAINSREMGKKLFDRENSYKKILLAINNCSFK